MPVRPVLLFCTFLLFCETGFVNSASANGDVDVSGCATLNPVLGGGFRPNCNSRWRRFRNDIVLFDTDFSTDEYGRRVTPQPPKPGAIQNTLFFGDSFTVGAGVNGDETTPFYYSAKSPRVNVYNYGGSGFGPQQMLVALSETDIKKQVTSARTSVAIYVFLPFHVQRAVGKPSIYNSFGMYFPFYDLKDDGRLVHEGTFTSGRPFLSKIYHLLGAVPLLGRAFEKLAEPASEKDIQITARIIEDSAKKFLEIFGSKEFYVLFYPEVNHVTASRLKPHLVKSGIRYFDYSTLVDISSPNAHLADGHPAAWVHRKVGERLAEDLK